MPADQGGTFHTLRCQTVEPVDMAQSSIKTLELAPELLILGSCAACFSQAANDFVNESASCQKITG